MVARGIAGANEAPDAGHLHSGGFLAKLAHTTTDKSRVRVWILRFAALAPVLILFGLLVAHGATSSQCDTCHSDPQFVASTELQPHAGVACEECHAPSGEVDRVVFRYRQLFHMASSVMPQQGRAWAQVPDTTCLKCHEAVIAAPTTANSLRIDHAVCAEGSRCTDCHSYTAHGDSTPWLRAYDMETCLGCHATQASSDCSLCHQGRLPQDRIASGTFAVTHGQQWEKTHGMGDSATCSACHTAASCENCHGVGLPHDAGFMQQHSSLSRSEGARCQTCHEKRFCDDCHGLRMPHTNEFTRGHAAQSKDNRTLCARCHAETDCTTCHETHVHPGGAIGTLDIGNDAGGGVR